MTENDFDSVIIDGKIIEPELLRPIEMKSVEDYNHLMRDIVNIQFGAKEGDFQTALITQLTECNGWKKLCASMDVIRDTQRAIEQYESMLESDFDYIKKGGALYLYGLLNSLYIQQDAVSTINQVLFGEKINFKEEQFAGIHLVRKIRDDVCHATNRNETKKTESQIFVSPTTVRKGGFEYLIFSDNDFKTISVDINDCISKQAKNVKQIILNLCKELFKKVFEIGDNDAKTTAQNLISDKYALTPDEIAFIESTIKQME